MDKEQLVPGPGGVKAWLAGVGGVNSPHTFIYYRGHIACDRGRFTVRDIDGVIQTVWLSCPPVEEVASLTWAASEEGDVVLVQRKLAIGDYLYIAIRSQEWYRKRRSS